MSTYVAKQPQGMKCVHVRIILENCINEFSQVDTTVQIQYQVEYPVLHCLINQNMGNQLVLSMSQLEKMPYLQKSKKYECLPNRALDTIYIYILFIYIYIYIIYIYIYIYILIQPMVGLKNTTTQADYSQFHSFCNHLMCIYFIYVFLKENNRMKILF